MQGGTISFPSPASDCSTFQRPLNSSISAMSFRISAVIVMFLDFVGADIHLYPLSPDRYPRQVHPLSPVCTLFDSVPRLRWASRGARRTVSRGIGWVPIKHCSLHEVISGRQVE